MSYIDAFTVSAPARVLLFGEHQAALGLPAVAMAVDSRVTVRADSIDAAAITLSLPDAPEEHCDLSGEDPHPGDGLLGRGIVALRDRGFMLSAGYKLILGSDLSADMGQASEAAAAVALTLALLRCGNHLQALTGVEIAGVAATILAEGAPALHDTLVCSLGGKQYVHAGKTRSLAGADLASLVVARAADDSSAAEPRPATAAIDALTEIDPSFHIATTSFDEAMPLLARLDDLQASALYAHLRSRDICAAARALMEAEFFEKDRLGEMLDEDHALHRDYLGLSNAEAESAVAAAKGAGALGAKVCAAGTTVLAYAPGDEDEIAKAIESQGWTARTVSVADGARLDAGAIVPPWA